MNLLIVALILLGSHVKAQDAEPDNAGGADNTGKNDELDLEPSYFAKNHPLRDSTELLALELKPSDDVRTSFKIISNNSDEVFYLGDMVEVLLGFENTGAKEIYITDVCGALVSPHDETQFIFNNTAVHHNITVRQNEYHSFYYPFLINPHFNPIAFGLVAKIYYVNARGDEYSSVVVNVTLDVRDAPGAIKVGKFFFIILIIAVVVTFGIVFRKQIIDFFVNLYKRLLGTGRHSSRKHSAGNVRGADGADEDDSYEWLKNTSTHAFQRQKERESEKEKQQKGKRSGGGKRDISESPNPAIGRGKRGRSPPSGTGTGTGPESPATSATLAAKEAFVLKKK